MFAHAPKQLVSLLAPQRSVSLLVHISPVEDLRIFFPGVTIKKEEENEAGGVILKVQVFLMSFCISSSAEISVLIKMKEKMKSHLQPSLSKHPTLNTQYVCLYNARTIFQY